MRYRALLLASVILGAAAGSARSEILVGVAGPLTGANAAVGEEFRKGAEMAAKTINDKGGINGQQIRLEFGDDASDPRQGVSVANKFVSDGVKFVVGHYNSGVSIPASEVYAENGVLEVTPGSTNPQYTDSGQWNTIRVCGRDDQQGAVAAHYIATHFTHDPVAVIDDKTQYGAGIAAEVKKGLHKAGIKETMAEEITVGDKDYSVLVTKMKQAGIKVIYFGGLFTEAGLLARQTADQGLKAVMIGGDGIASSEFAQIAGPAAVGTLMTFAPDPRVNPHSQAAVTAIRAGGFEPEAYTLYTYAALQVIQSGIEKSKSMDAETVAKQIKSGKSIPTVLGTLKFDSKGDRTDEDYTMYRWDAKSDGKIDYQMLK